MNEQRNSHVPLRMCAICRRRFPKGQLNRYIATKEGGLQADERKTIPGRGIYCCDAAGCREKFVKFKPKASKRSRGDV